MLRALLVKLLTSKDPLKKEPTMKSPVSYLSDEYYTALPIRERYLHVANSYVGQKEVGNNWGPFVKATLAFSGIFGPAPWCAAFTTRSLVEAGMDKKKLPKLSASTYYWYVHALENKCLVRPTKQEESDPSKSAKRGDLFVWNNKNGGHIGVVTKVNYQNGTFETIEGNTNDSGGREGYKVARRVRSFASLRKNTRWGFISVSCLNKIKV